MPGPGIWKSQPNALAVCFRLQLQSFVPCGGHYSQEMFHWCPGEGLGRCLTGRTLQFPTKFCRELHCSSLQNVNTTVKEWADLFPKKLRDSAKGEESAGQLLLSRYCWLNGRWSVCLNTQSEDFRGTAWWSLTSHQRETGALRTGVP